MKSITTLLWSGLLLASLLPAAAATYVFQTRGASPAGNVQTTWITNGVPDLPTGPSGNHRLNDWGVADANNRILMSFDLSQIKTDAGGQNIMVNYVMIEILRSSWTNGWASNSLWTTSAFDPAAATWANSSEIGQNYIGDIGGANAFTMVWDSRTPGPNAWDSSFDDLVPDVQGDLDANRTADYVLRVDVGNEWSTTIGADNFKLTVDVSMVPEPSTALCALLGLSTLTLRRRR